MSTVTVSMIVAENGVADPDHVFAGLSAHECQQLFNHFIAHAQAKAVALLPDPALAPVGTNTVVLDILTTRDDTGAKMGSQRNEYAGLDDASVAGLRGIFDGALAALDQHLLAKHKHAAPGKK